MSYSRIIKTKKGGRVLWYCKKCGRRAYLDMKGGTFSYKQAVYQPKVCSGCGMLDFACICEPVKRLEIIDGIEHYYLNPDLKVGDKVYTWYYGIRHVAIVVAIKGSKARLRFRNQSGLTVEHWKPIKILKKVESEANDSG